jgi:hypothetical protein
MANEAVVVRDHHGNLTIFDGTSGGAGTSFFLGPRSDIARMTWTVYNEPVADGTQTASHKTIDKIDMRIQRTYYSFTVRTNDNVQLRLVGTIFWRISDVKTMVLGTSDPVADVWLHSRSSFMQSVSNVSFDLFMGSFNQLAKSAYERDIADGFYDDRGVYLESMEVTRFEAVDEKTKETLQSINEETIRQITLLKQQEGDNAVEKAKMLANIDLQKEYTASELKVEELRTELIQTQADNGLIKKKKEAEAHAQPFAQAAAAFVGALNTSGVDIDSGVELYETLKEADHHNVDTKNLASGQATLFLTSSDVKLNIRDLNLGGGNSTERGQHEHDL